MDNMYHEGFENSFYSIEAFSVIGTNLVQEDAVGVKLFDTGAVLILCDGIGGMPGGQKAAITAVEAIKKYVAESARIDAPAEFLRKAFELADDSVYFLKDEIGKRIGCGCTVLVALIIGRKIYCGNIGDSRIYYYSGDDFTQVSRDHNYGELIRERFRQGKISESEFNQNMSAAAALTGYLGLGELKEYYISESPIVLDRNHVLCLQSDGLYKLLSDSEMKEIISTYPKDLEKAGCELLLRAEEKKDTYQDNTSFILLRLK